MFDFSFGWKNTPYKSYLYYSWALMAVALIALFSLKGFLPPLVPLFYGKPISEAQLSPVLGLLIPIGTSIVVTFINLLLNFAVKDLFLKKILVTSSLLISILIAVTVIKIIFLVGFF